MLLELIVNSVTGVFREWHRAKTALEQLGMLGNDAWHVLAGVLLQILLALVLRVSLSSLRPWLALLALLLLNEAVDLWVERWPDLDRQLAESVKDVVLTMFIPTVLLLAVRHAPGLFHRGRVRRRRR